MLENLRSMKSEELLPIQHHYVKTMQSLKPVESSFANKKGNPLRLNLKNTLEEIKSGPAELMHLSSSPNLSNNHLLTPSLETSQSTLLQVSYLLKF